VLRWAIASGVVRKIFSAVILVLAPNFLFAAATDLSGDGRSDVLFSTVKVDLGVLQMNGATVTGAVTILGANTGWQATHVVDMDSDNKDDVLLRNDDGRIALLLMDGATVRSFTTLVNADSGWKVTHVGDFNGDGRRDLIIRNDDGRSGLLLMNAAAVLSFNTILPSAADYTVTHTGDFNADGKSDLVLLHADGSSVVLLMNGASGLAAAYLLPAASPWKINIVADFNGDGRSDIVVSQADGSAAVLLMNGTAVSAASLLLTAGSTWTVTHTGDFNADGKSDLLLGDESGAIALLLMDGSAVSDASYLAVPDGGLMVAGIGDFNGDRRADVVAVDRDGVAYAILLSGVTVSGVIALWGAGSTSIAPKPSGTLSLLPSFLTKGPIVFPSGFMKSIKEYGAAGDGVTDDTAAIQKALNDGRRDANGSPLFNQPDELNGRPKALYFPAGTYLVSDTVDWFGCCVTLQGQGAASTIIKLKSGAAKFQNPAAPRPVIRTENGNMSFRQNIWDMQILSGAGNPGAIGLDYVANNSGAVRNVLIKSEDGAGISGLELTRNWPGPNMFKNVHIEGFDYGIRVNYIEYSQTYENILLKNQRVAAIKNDGAVMAMRNIVSYNKVPAIKNDGYGTGLITLLDSKLLGGNSSVSAIETSSAKQAYIYLRNVNSSGYQSLVRNDGVVLPGLSAGEWYSSSKVYSLFTNTPTASMLKLPVQNTPAFHDNSLVNWAAVTCAGYDCQVSTQLQHALDSGKSTVYFPFGIRLVYNELTVFVPSTVKRILGFSGVINTDANGINGGGIRFVVQGDSAEPLVIEQFGYGVKVEHRGKRPVALKHLLLYEYKALPGAGDVFAEDVQMDGFTIQASQRFWGRQVNNERRDATKIINYGTLWILGMKTEGQQTVIDARGGFTEYLGGLVYPATSDLQPGEIAFKLSSGAQASLLYSNIVYTTRNYDVQIEENRAGNPRRLNTSAAPERTRLFVSH
jgi:Pectate lyase superfamily protein/FG-GAP-like repeat